jgi:4-alpha-glucanotransferase
VLLGEDLGLVPPAVNRGMSKHGVARMYVQSFEMTGDERQPLRPPKRESIASFGTHDLPPFAAFWTDADLDLRRQIGVMTDETARELQASRAPAKHALWQHLAERGLAGPEASANDAYRGATRLLAESPAAWTVLNLEDTWGETQPQNIPGTTEAQHPNWIRRAKYPLEQFEAIDDITKALDVMRSVRSAGKEEQHVAKE